MDTKYESAREELIGLLHKANDVSSALAVLSWDQTTYMPPGGATARARQIATLQGIAHELSSDVRIGQLLDILQPYVDQLPPEDDDAALVRVVRREYERTIRVPTAFTREAASHFAESYARWTTARPDNDFAAVLPYLEKTIAYSRQFADFFPGYNHIADPLIDGYDVGVTVTQLTPLLSDLGSHLQSLIAAVDAQPAPDQTFLFKHYPRQSQWEFGVHVIKRLGYDFDRGRLDSTHHPYMTQFALGDVRITTRIMEEFLPAGLFGTIHEAGHGMYEQGINSSYDGTPLANGTSSGIHESQSRLWENLVGRSLAFWEFYYPQLQSTFSDQLQTITLESFYRAINKVEKSLIRVEADEVTYNLHIIIRFQLGLQLLEGRLHPADLPMAWAEQYQRRLGVAPTNDTEGVLQDVHWFADLIGGSFHGYTLGNILAAQIFQAAQIAHPEIEAEMRVEGTCSALHQWLLQNIYVHGSKFTTEELIQRITGGPILLEPYFDYLQGKYGQLYQL